MTRTARSVLRLLFFVCLTPGVAPAQETPRPAERYPVQLAPSLKFGDEFVEVTSAGTLRRRYRVWGDFAGELAAWKTRADEAAKSRKNPPRTFRLAYVFLKNASIVFPDVPGADGRPLRATYSTPPDFERQMRERTTREYADFTWAFTGGEVRCEWVFETVADVTWTAAGKQTNWGCQPRAIGEQLATVLAKHQDAAIDMWVWCGGRPRTENGAAKQQVGGPPYGISYTQWQLFGGYSLVVTAPHLPLLVHEVNHRYLDNLETIEGVQLTLFHGLNAMGYSAGDLGYPDLLAVYRSVYLHVIRPAMWRRFSLTGNVGWDSVPTGRDRVPTYRGKLYAWDEVADDCWFKLPLLGESELRQLTGLPTLRLAADRQTHWRHFTVDAADRTRLRSPYVAEADDRDTALNNLLSLHSESCAVLHTETGHWLVVRPEAADVYVRLGKGPDRQPLSAAGWINEGVRPLLVFGAPAELPVPEREIDYFR